MFHFTHPEYLYLALLVPLLLWWWLRRRRGAVRLPNAGFLGGLPRGRSRLALWTGALLRGVALLALVLALSGPRWPDLRTRLQTKGIAIVLVVDVSKSMAQRDFDWQRQPITRLDAVKRVFRLFVEGGPGPGGGVLEGRRSDLIGLVTFGTWPKCDCPLTLSHPVLLKILEGREPLDLPGEAETNITDALVIGLDRLQAAGPRRKVLILLSDGEDVVPEPASGWGPPDAAQRAADLGIPIYTIDAAGAGPPSMAPEARAKFDQTRKDAEQMLRDVAESSGGRYFQARDTAALLEVYRDIDRREKSAIDGFKYRRYHEAYPWLALGSFVCIGVALLLDMTVWRRVP